MGFEKVIPESVMALIEADFKTSKPPRNYDRKYFCVDCCSHALTESEKEREHQNHHLLKPFSCSKYYAYEKQDMIRLSIDISQVAVFSVNSKSVIFPKSRSNYYSSTYYLDNNMNNGGLCVKCGWKLSDKPGLYCSILCKLLYEGWVPPQGHAQVHDIGLSIMDQNRVCLGSDSGDHHEADSNNVINVKKGQNNNKGKLILRLRLPVNGGSKMINKAKYKSKVNDSKLVALINSTVVVNGDHSNINKVESSSVKLRGRLRWKGNPRRAPLF